jgi:tRNA threonylcarbamoyl adenosine modification protein (Sua5/YciO/YrdC/YwlC family)
MERARGIADALSTLLRNELVVLPTDTVYGIACDAFKPFAVVSLLKAKGRGRDMPPPVLVGSVRAATALIEDLGVHGKDLIDEFWPGALTIVCKANSTLAWDLGDTKGTVAVRMPLHDVTLELLKESGPLAVSSANLSGAPAARDAANAEEQLGDAVSVYLDAGPAGEGEASSIVDLTGPVPRLLRAGAISEEELRAVCGVLLVEDDEEETGGDETGEATEDAKKDAVQDVEEDAGQDVEATEDAKEDAGQDVEATEDAKEDAGQNVEATEDAKKDAGQDVEGDAGQDVEATEDAKGDADAATDAGEGPEGDTESAAVPVGEKAAEKPAEAEGEGERTPPAAS